MTAKKGFFVFFSIIFLFAGALVFCEETIQLAILLDTSSSMDGLIDQAKTQLWKIVNQLALAKRNGQSPVIEVALYEYGNDRLSASTGYIRQVLPLTRDLDKVSESLFGLTTNGGYEYCGAVIERATEELAWSRHTQALKLIFIAGNEEFNQGGTDYRVAGKAAITAGIIINTIFCGDFNEGVRTFWKAGAEIADGSYSSINQDAALTAIAAPQDDEIIRLNAALNQTYVPYGREGEAGQALQLAQDENAAKAGAESYVDRSVAKTQLQYANERWDLVDAVNSGAVDLRSVPAEALPTELRGKSEAEIQAYLDQKTRERAQIQERIRKLEEERSVFIESERNKLGNDRTLDSAVISIIREQAQEKSFIFDR